MTSTLTVPRSDIPIGRVTIGDESYDIPQSAEFVRFFFDLARRAGGTTAQTNVDLATLINEIDAEAQIPLADIGAQEALRAVDELRNELSSMRSDYQRLQTALDEREVEFAALRSHNDLRARVEQLEDRLT